MSSTAEATEETSGDQEEVATDERREALVERIRTELGDALIDHHIPADTDLWIRVDRERWVDTGLFLRDGLGCAYFNFLSVIDWMPSPFGREMEAEVDADPEVDTKEPEAMQQGVAGGDSRFQLFARVNNVIDHMGITIKTDLEELGGRKAENWPFTAIRLANGNTLVNLKRHFIESAKIEADQLPHAR
ncbi:MAG: hypothetical protein IH843_03860, partial [Thaumarchaeota archaeon]|nr:hypothetical protein [Nitrososphaerota archaeon]